MATSGSDHTLASRGSGIESAPELPQGSKIDRYVILEVLGKGGMGVVYKAYDTLRNQDVAYKTLQNASGKTLLLFKNEFRALSDA